VADATALAGAGLSGDARTTIHGDVAAPPAPDPGVTVVDEPSRPLTFHLALLGVLLVALGVVVFLLSRQLNLFGKAATTSIKATATAPVTVPSDLVGKTYTDAADEAARLGLKVTRNDVQDSQHPESTVIATTPAAGQKVQPGGGLVLDVSSGPAPITEPDVLGEDAQAAAAQLQQAGFTVGPQQTQSSGTVPAGAVISTNPPAGYQGHPRDRVTMVVSSGPGQVAVPDVTGKDQTTATNTLTQAGFRVRVGSQQSSATVPAGSVIQTNPAAGTTALQGSVVTLELSSGPAKVRVPYVLNYTEANARADIEARGLVVAESTQTVGDPSKDGVVLDQTPGAGVTVYQGSTVDLVIGQYQGTTTTTSGVPLGL